jgi:hypothetical protein
MPAPQLASTVTRVAGPEGLFREGDLDRDHRGEEGHGDGLGGEQAAQGGARPDVVETLAEPCHPARRRTRLAAWKPPRGADQRRDANE